MNTVITPARTTGPRPRTTPRSSSASRPPGPAATTPSSAPPCRSSARRSPRPSTCAPASACSTSPPATATPRSPRRAASPTSRPPTTSRRCSTSGRAPRRGRRPGRAVPGRRRRGACPSTTDSFDVVLSTFGVMFAPDHAPRRARDAARRAPGRHDRDGQLDAGRFHRPPVPDRRRPTCRRRAGLTLAGAVGHRGPPRLAVRPARPRPSCAAQNVLLPLPLGRALRAGLPRPVRPDRTRPSRRWTRPARRRSNASHGAAERGRHRRRPRPGRAERVRRDRGHGGLMKPEGASMPASQQAIGAGDLCRTRNRQGRALRSHPGRRCCHARHGTLAGQYLHGQECRDARPLRLCPRPRQTRLARTIPLSIFADGDHVIVEARGAP